MFKPVQGSVNFPELEVEVGAFWRESGIYQKSLDARADAQPFVFYEGPPTANGMPHPGHCLTRAIKDLFPRYKTMQGYRCERKAGWDTHGLPVEVEVCKELGIHSKEEIEAYGIEPFIQKCQASVWRYMQEWERLTERLGFWVNLEEAYVTYHQSYIESVWWSLKNLFDRDLLYQGHKIVWWWAQGGTALSAGEVGQGYREVADPSVFVKFPLLDDDGNVTDTSLLVWTTTPWTLPSNQFVAVNPEIEYATVVDEEEGTLIVANDLVETISAKLKRELEVVSACRGVELVDRKYLPPFDQYWQRREKCEWHSPDAMIYAHQEVRSTYEHMAPGTPDEQRDTNARDYLQSHNLENGWHIVPADFVTTDAGTGLVHVAPAFGEDDMRVLQRRQSLLDPEPRLINCVAPNGKFTDEAPEFLHGTMVTDNSCQKAIIRDLKERDLLFHQEQYLHDYPFCWRAEQDRLIQYPRESWFIKTTEFKDRMVENNRAINWMPEHIKEGRMGNFLGSNVDWALSRERYWGTPLPIWVCEETGKKEAIGSYDELLAKPGATGTEVWEAAKKANPELPDDLRVHKPYIDAVAYDSPFAPGARMERVTEVIDCWYDSGAMPFAQWGYRGQESGPEREKFDSQFPADFISEALDQTRGWFYSQLAISTMLFGDKKQTEAAAPTLPHPFKNCIVLGLMLGEDGQKMSKSKGNYRTPNEIFDRYGADALRWYFFANQPPWTSIRYSEQSIKDSIPEFLLRLWNCYSFMVIYANIDVWDPGKECADKKCSSRSLDPSAFQSAKSYRPVPERAQADRWILSEMHSTIATVTSRLDAYDNFGACTAINDFVDALSNWYVRRSRDRFWSKDKREASKLDAYWTLYECLVTTTKLVAPFVPFLAETMWQNLSGMFDGAAESVHLCDYPEADTSLIDQDLSERMALVRLISSLGRRAREAENLKVRQPLSSMQVILADTTHQAWLQEHASALADELNVKVVEYSSDPEKYVDHQVLPNFKLLGKKLGKLIPKVKQALSEATGSELLANIRDNGEINLTVEGQEIALVREEVEFRITAKPGYAAANDKGVVVVLATELTPELISEGLARDLVRAIQDRRKELGCEFTDRIAIGLDTSRAEPVAAINTFSDYIKRETLAGSLVLEPLEGAEPLEISLGDSTTQLYVRVIS